MVTADRAVVVLSRNFNRIRDFNSSKTVQFNIPEKFILNIKKIPVITVVEKQLFSIQCFIADPGEARGCSTNTSVPHSLTDSWIEC